MNFEEYQLHGRAKYAAFVDAIRAILAALVDAHDLVPHGITGRAKDPVSLKKKLADRKIDPASAIDEVLKDLAGARIVFFTNSQVDQFRSSGAIHENFNVININEHHAVPGTATEEKLFDSTNYLVELKPDRVSLPEYRRFAGMRAEIQVQTLLNHAWAEMGHDTIYKKPKLQHVDPRHLEAINERMKKVMREHLLPAGHDFDKIARDFNRIVRADSSFEDTLKTIETSASNDELLGAFETFDTLVMPVMANGRNVFAKFIPRLADAVERVRGSEAGTVESVFGEFPGKSGEIVARRAADLLSRGWFVDLKLSLETLVRLYVGAQSDAERKIWADAGARFADHDLDAWQAAGPVVQQAIVDGIAGLGAEQRRAARGLIVAMSAKILSCEVSGTKRGALNTVLLHNGPVGAGEPLRKVRWGAIDMLEQLLGEAEDDPARSAILAALWSAASLPFHGGGEALRIIVMEDAKRVGAIVRGLSGGWGLELRRKTEVSARHVYRNFHFVPAEMEKNEALVAAQKALVAELSALREALNADEEFSLYKTMVGRDSVRPDGWDDSAFDYKATEAWRAERFTEIAGQAKPEDADAWIARTRRYLGEQAGSTERWPMADFIARLAEVRPEIGQRFLQQMDAELSPVLVGLLRGLEAGGQREFVQRYVARFIGQGRFLVQLADWFRRREEADIDLLTTVADRARELSDVDAVLEAINSAGNIYRRVSDARLIDAVFLPCATYLGVALLPDWIGRAWGIVEGAIVAALDEARSRTLLDSFVAIPIIDFEADRVLAIVAGKYPDLVFDFFGARVERDANGDGRRFEPIPFDFHDLSEALAKHPVQLLTTTRGWYARSPLYHVFRGGRLVGNVFPELTPEVVEPLREMIEKGDRDDLAFVLETLVAYDGDEGIFALCMDVVERLDDGDELLGRVSGVLGERGILMGHFGSVEANRAEHEHLAGWVKDPRPKVQAFATEERRRLEQWMASEQRRAERELEQMARDWDVPEVATSADGAKGD